MLQQVNKVALLLAGIMVWSYSCAQDQNGRLTTEERGEVINSVIDLLHNNYVYPEVASSMEKSIRENLNSGKYQTILDHNKFAEVLTEDLYAISKDKHLRVRYNPAAPESISGNRSAPRDEMLIEAKKRNYGFEKVGVLAGNIGYIDLRGFMDAGIAAQTAHEAMAKVSNTEVLIFDLRQNGGGSPSMIQLLTSYLYDSEPVHLNSFYWRPADQYSETWTLKTIPGKRRPDRPVYILTSNRTFSAAEEFSYNLKNLKRATLVGETTGGGAHPGGIMPATANYSVWVPQGRAINPVTGTNWEGTGVEPHVRVSADIALSTAYSMAIEDLRKKTGDPAYGILLKKLENNEIDLSGD